MSNSVAALLSSYREGEGVSKRELARRTGLTVQAISDLENGRYLPSRKNHSKIATAYGVDEERLHRFVIAEDDRLIRSVAEVQSILEHSLKGDNLIVISQNSVADREPHKIPVLTYHLNRGGYLTYVYYQLEPSTQTEFWHTNHPSSARTLSNQLKYLNCPHSTNVYYLALRELNLDDFPFLRTNPDTTFYLSRKSGDSPDAIWSEMESKSGGVWIPRGETTKFITSKWLREYCGLELGSPPRLLQERTGASLMNLPDFLASQNS